MALAVARITMDGELTGFTECCSSSATDQEAFGALFQSLDDIKKCYKNVNFRIVEGGKEEWKDM